MLACILASLLFWVGVAAAGDAADAAQRPKYQQLMQQSNWKDAYDGFRKLVLDPNDDPAQASQDLRDAVTCLNRLNRRTEFDELAEKAVETHKVELAPAAHGGRLVP